MENNLLLTQEEFGSIESALEMAINTLRNRFDDEPGYIHPAKSYEVLYDKIKEWSEPLPVSNYSISATKG